MVLQKSWTELSLIRESVEAKHEGFSSCVHLDIQ